MSYRIAMLIALSINKHSSLKLFKTHFELIMHFILVKAYFFQKNLCNLLQKCHAYYIILLSFLLLVPPISGSYYKEATNTEREGTVHIQFL